MFSAMDDDEEAHFSSCIHGYHIYNPFRVQQSERSFTVQEKLGMWRADMQSMFYNRLIDHN